MKVYCRHCKWFLWRNKECGYKAVTGVDVKGYKTYSWGSCEGYNMGLNCPYYEHGWRIRFKGWLRRRKAEMA